MVPRAQTIERENRKIKVQVNAAFEGKNFGPTREKITETMNALGLPRGITWSWNQRLQEQAEQGASMGLNFLLALPSGGASNSRVAYSVPTRMNPESSPMKGRPLGEVGMASTWKPSDSTVTSKL